MTSMASPTPTTSPDAAVSSPEQQHEDQLQPPVQQQDASPSAPASQQDEQPQYSDSSFLAADDDASVMASDGQKHPKGKRKRTTAKDKMILEEAYSKNPKPDKVARQDIVQRVTLNEKEVQIWFQNRRQNDRRKSRPLSPQEIAALRYGGGPGISSDPITSSVSAVTTAPAGACPASDPAASSSQTFSVSSPPPPPSASQPSVANASLTSTGPDSHHHHHHHQRSFSEATPRREDLSSSQESQDGSRSLSQSFSGSVGYLANRWNLGSSFSTPSQSRNEFDDSRRTDPTLQTPSQGSDCGQDSLSSSQSSMRIRLSLEGKAELVPSNASPHKSTLTTPTLPQVRQRSLQRSHSDLPSITLPPISALTGGLPPPRLPRGRSRNVLAWESCADAADTRDDLIAQAENESNGSAIAAISLLRSTSGVLQPSGSKRNAPSAKTSREHQPPKKAKLSRSNSSVARMENHEEYAEKALDGKVKISMLVSPTDSDKENWSPDEDGSGEPRSRRRRPLPSSPKLAASVSSSRRLGRVLQEQTKGPAFLSNRANTAPVRRHRKGDAAVNIFEDVDKASAVRGGTDPALRSSKTDEEVEKFMRGEVSPSKKGDMDCVAGLLSLSQGAWR